MAKITFMGAGSTVFAKNILSDCMVTPALQDAHIALYDIDSTRLKESQYLINKVNRGINKGRAKVTAHLGVRNRRAALRDANYVVNAIQIGGYEPATVIDFEVPKKYGLRQTIGDTIGIGGLFRTLRTIPVMMDFAREMEAVCPDALFLNYTNPMAALTGAMLRYTNIHTVGLCHSVQVCAESILRNMEIDHKPGEVQWKIAGINHMAWLLEVTQNGRDLYPEIKKAAKQKLREWRKPGAEKNWDMVRTEMMLQFGYYITESSEHLSEYVPYWIKSRYPELIEEYNIPLDEYPRRCIRQLAEWKKMRRKLKTEPIREHGRTAEYGSYIMEAMETGVPFSIGGNVLNTGLITNLPQNACVEASCLVDHNGVQGCVVGDLPEQCAALNRTNINTQLLSIEAAMTHKREHIYQAAMLDPHTSAELSIDDIRKLCNELIRAHGSMLPKYR